MIIVYILIALAVVLVIWAIAIYNKFIRLQNRTEEAWADIDVQLKRRYDLIPNLVNTVKGYMEHERGTFEKVTEARTRALNAENSGDPQEIGRAENMLTGALKTLFAVAENYPDLKANTNFLELQRELSDTENKIQAARRFYNSNVRDLNTSIETFPQSIVAGAFNFKQREFFEIGNEEERDVVNVEF